MVQAREEFPHQLAQFKPEDVFVLDESGANIAMTRAYGRALLGQRVQAKAPRNWGENLTMVAVIGLVTGVLTEMTVNGAMDGVTFLAFVEQWLAPKLRPGQVVIMDNLSAHKVQGVQEAIEAKGAYVLYLPPYSPDLSPIELFWSKVKTYMRGAGAKTREELEKAFVEAMELVTLEDIKGWFKHCGYSV